MSVSDVVALASELIKFRSLSGEEALVTEFLVSTLTSRGWPVERFAVRDGRENILVSFGTPEILFTTHTDVVPAPDNLFEPRVIDDKLFGRGACDTKGIIATMISTAAKLRSKGVDNFGLLFVVGEEHDGIGARTAAQQLQGRGIRFIINGEPTECKVMRAHKGALDLALTCRGTACHSGYPEAGVDANRALIEVLSRILAANWPVDTTLGKTTVNVGFIQGGITANIVSPSAEARILFRTVSPNPEILEAVKALLSPICSLEVAYDMPVVSLLEIADMPSDVAAYCTDIPFFAPLGAECVLYGPGSILAAHTDDEHIALKQIEEAIIGYEHIFHVLRKRS